MHLASESSLPRMEVSSGAGPDDDQPKRGTVYTVTHFLKAGLFSFLGVSFFCCGSLVEYSKFQPLSKKGDEIIAEELCLP